MNAASAAESIRKHGMSVVGRITPFAFAIVFAASGAVGPIIGQNLGAKKYDIFL